MQLKSFHLALIGSVVLGTGAFAQTSGSVTGPAGKTTTYQGQRGGGSASQTVTGPNGQSATRTATHTATGSGGMNTTATTSGPRGNGATRTGSVAVNR